MKVSRALEGSYRGRKVYTTDAPTSGPALLHMLNLVEKFDFIGEGRTALNAHRCVEAMKCEWVVTVCFFVPLVLVFTLYGVVGYAAR